MTITITAFESSPDGGKGLARDTRVRWALEEVGEPYQVRPVSFRAMKEPAHLALHPFGQIPTYEEGDLALFESGAIVFHIAERYAGLLPEDANARARAITWMFAALSTVEPPILELGTAKLYEGDKPWSKERLPLVQDRVRSRLRPLSARLGGRRVARWRVQRGRLDDGVGAAPGEIIRHSGRISEPLRLCCARRSAARLQACLRCTTVDYGFSTNRCALSPVPKAVGVPVQSEMRPGPVLQLKSAFHAQPRYETPFVSAQVM
jgi:glutathione S-transferase